VSLHPLSKRFFKSTRPEAQLGFGIALGDHLRGATPSEYLDRLALQNRIFGDDIRLERIVRISPTSISIVTSQPAITGFPASQEEIDEYMAAMEFEKFGAGIYFDPRRLLLIYDVYPRNMLVAEREIPHVIDPVLQRVTPDFADFIRTNPHLVDHV